MDEYLVPSEYGEDEFIEKKSRFIGHIAPVADAAEAEAFIAKIRSA